ncbi:hypothetical protein [Caballeronia sp. J97]|uniref:hypothetical protein n=1 Tax=Caballeronia sp. J97 TaxID=2805429 RepID=UPI002AAF61C0|nr:hypothetical protein [Caballeronia sp. J97]
MTGRKIAGLAAGDVAANSADAEDDLQFCQTNPNVSNLIQRVNNVETTGSACMLSQVAQPAAVATGNGCELGCARQWLGR